MRLTSQASAAWAGIVTRSRTLLGPKRQPLGRALSPSWACGLSASTTLARIITLFVSHVSHVGVDGPKRQPLGHALSRPEAGAPAFPRSQASTAWASISARKQDRSATGGVLSVDRSGWHYHTRLDNLYQLGLATTSVSPTRGIVSSQASAARASIYHAITRDASMSSVPSVNRSSAHYCQRICAPGERVPGIDRSGGHCHAA